MTEERNEAHPLGRVGSTPRQELVEDDPEGVNIVSGVETVGALGVSELLGTHVLRRPHHRIDGQLTVAGQRLIQRLGQTEVDHLDDRLVLLPPHQEVRRLQIPMNDAALVRVLHPSANLQEEFEPLFDRQAARVAELVDREAAFDVFHREVGKPLLRGARLEDLRDVGMREPRHRLAFGLEAGRRDRMASPRWIRLIAKSRRKGSSCSPR